MGKKTEPKDLGEITKSCTEKSLIIHGIQIAKGEDRLKHGLSEFMSSGLDPYIVMDLETEKVKYHKEFIEKCKKNPKEYADKARKLPNYPKMIRQFHTFYEDIDDPDFDTVPE